MYFRHSDKNDITGIMRIVAQAQQYLKQSNIDQWQNNYPNGKSFEEDIRKGNSYVVIENDTIIATFYVSFDGDPNYKIIEDGKWSCNNEYAVIHRVAVDNQIKGTGLGSVIFKEIERMCIERKVFYIRVDTHEENLSMQRLLDKNGFKYCGIIYVTDHKRRKAYDKLL